MKEKNYKGFTIIILKDTEIEGGNEYKIYSKKLKFLTSYPSYCYVKEFINLLIKRFGKKEDYNDNEILEIINITG